MNQSSIPSILNDLFDAELNSIFRFLDDSAPYLDRTTAEFRGPLEEMVQSSQRRAQELYNLIERLGGSPIPRGLQPEEQYDAYLSMKFLLPKLVVAKQMDIARYEEAGRAIGDRSPEAAALLESHLAEHRSQLEILERAVESTALIRM